MLKSFAVILLGLLSLSSQASSPMEQVMSVKERLRIHLWIEGITPDLQKEHPKQKNLPEQIERPLRKIVI